MTTDRPSRPRPLTRTDVIRFVLAGLVVPVVAVIVGIVAILLAAPTLPDPVAVHWGANGLPDGFAGVGAVVLLLALTGLLLPVLLTLVTLPSVRRGEGGYSAPFLGAVSAGLGTFLAVMIAVATVRQSGLDDAAAGPAIWVPLLVGLGAGIVVGVAAWFVQPRHPYVATPVGTAVETPVAPGEHVVWLQRVTLARGGIVTLGAVLVLLVGLIVLFWVMGLPLGAQGVLIGVTVLMVVALATTVAFHVRVDASGLTVTSSAGWPRVHVPLADIADATAVHVEPFGEFGGWGIRWAPTGRFGIVLRTGDGILVRRRNGKTVTVTVDDAATGAALLRALR